MRPLNVVELNLYKLNSVRMHLHGFIFILEFGFLYIMLIVRYMCILVVNMCLIVIYFYSLTLLNTFSIYTSYYGSHLCIWDTLYEHYLLTHNLFIIKHHFRVKLVLLPNVFRYVLPESVTNNSGIVR